MSRTVLYARVSTAEQTIAHQRTQAEAAGFVIDDVIEDERRIKRSSSISRA